MKKVCPSLEKETNCKCSTQNQTTNNYGIVKGLVKEIVLNNKESNVENSFKKKKKFPHFNFSVQVDQDIYHANINVQSRNPQSPNLKIYYTENPTVDLANADVFTNAVNLAVGAYPGPAQNLSLDYLRGNYFKLDELVIPTEPGKTSEKDVLTDILNKYISQGESDDEFIVIWGSLYNDNQRLGIHDIHMNQGNRFALNENGTWQDGGFMFCDKKTVKFACFLTFAEQCLVTDDKGNCK